MAVKDLARRLIDSLPENASMDDIIHALYVNAKFEHGEREIREGKGGSAGNSGGRSQRSTGWSERAAEMPGRGRKRGAGTN